MAATLIFFIILLLNYLPIHYRFVVWYSISITGREASKQKVNQEGKGSKNGRKVIKGIKQNTKRRFLIDKQKF